MEEILQIFAVCIAMLILGSSLWRESSHASISGKSVSAVGYYVKSDPRVFVIEQISSTGTGIFEHLNGTTGHLTRAVLPLKIPLRSRGMQTGLDLLGAVENTTEITSAYKSRTTVSSERNQTGLQNLSHMFVLAECDRTKSCMAKGDARVQFVDRTEKVLGNFSTVLMVGDSTIRYQFGAFCNCVSGISCAMNGVRGTIKRLKLCGPRKSEDTRQTTSSAHNAMVVFDEIAGGPHHMPWGHRENRANATIARFQQAIDQSKRQRLVVYANFAALHLLFQPVIGGWDIVDIGGGKRQRSRGADFNGLMHLTDRLSAEYQDYKRAGADLLIVMLPHWVCIQKLPGSIRKYVDASVDDNRTELGLDECVSFLKKRETMAEYPEFIRKSDSELRNFCVHSQLDEKGTRKIAKLLQFEVNRLKETQNASIALVDAYSMTKQAGCGDTSDGRHWGMDTVLSEWNSILDAVQSHFSHEV